MDCFVSDPDNGHGMGEDEHADSNETAEDAWKSDAQPWKLHPNRDMILKLADRADLDKFGSRGELPIPTCRELIHNAMASVQLLDRLGADIVYSHGLGIDYAGRIYRPGPSEENYHEDFCEMVACVQEKLRLRELRKAIRRKIKTFSESIGFSNAAHPDGPLFFCVRNRHLEKVGALHQAVHAELNDPSLDNLSLQWILSRCSPAERELYDFILLNERVGADLVKDGSSDKWTELIGMWEAAGMAGDVVNAANGMVEQERVRDMINNDLRAMGGLLNRTLDLRDDLVAAIEELSPPA